jgi:NADH dehydrogenase [ubiquinone] 1 alpha subcomplex assembly factor 7
MMSDILRTMRNFKDIYNSISEVALIETSDKLRIVQENTLKKFDDIKINWYQDLDELNGEKFIIVANEFFDALPIKQYCLKDNKIYEAVVSLDQDGNFTFGLINNISHYIDINKFGKNQLIELSEYRANYVDKISNKIFNNNGGAIIIDYGYIEPLNKSSLQAVKLHKKVELFDNIGESDITSLVDFTSLQKDFEKNNIASNTTNQSDFLLKYGIFERGEALIKSGASKENIDFQLNKLTSDKEMGSLFKILVTE